MTVEPYFGTHDGKRHIRKENLLVGTYYYGTCRNATVARWDGELFWYWREKFGSEYLESIHCPEDDDQFDLFYAQASLYLKDIPLAGILENRP